MEASRERENAGLSQAYTHTVFWLLNTGQQLTVEPGSSLTVEPGSSFSAEGHAKRHTERQLSNAQCRMPHPRLVFKYEAEIPLDVLTHKGQLAPLMLPNLHDSCAVRQTAAPNSGSKHAFKLLFIILHKGHSTLPPA